MSGDKSLEEMCGAFYANCSPAQKTVIYTDYDYMKATPNETDAGAGFREFLFKAVKKADFGNLRKLFMGCPHEVTSWMLGQAGRLPTIGRG